MQEIKLCAECIIDGKQSGAINEVEYITVPSHECVDYGDHGDVTDIIGNHTRDRILGSGGWLNVECDCDNLTICQNHHDMAEALGIDPLELVGILAEIQGEE